MDLIAIQEALLRVVYSDDYSKIEALISSNEDPETNDLLIRHALGTCNWELIRRLEEGGITISRDIDPPGHINLILSEFGNVPSAVSYLVEHGAAVELRGYNNWTPLHLAARNSYEEVAEILLNAGASVDARTDCDGGWTPLMEACVANSSIIVEMLLEWGADVTIVNSIEGKTARQIALASNSSQAVAVIDGLKKKR